MLIWRYLCVDLTIKPFCETQDIDVNKEFVKFIKENILLLEPIDIKPKPINVILYIFRLSIVILLSIKLRKKTMV